MLTRCRRISPGSTILVIGASGTVGTALPDLSRHLGLKAIGTCSAASFAGVQRFGATAIDYHADDFVVSARRLTAERLGGLLVCYGSQTMAIGREGLVSAALGLVRLKLWGAFSFLFGGRRSLFYSNAARRRTHPEDFKADTTVLFERPPAALGFAGGSCAD